MADRAGTPKSPIDRPDTDGWERTETTTETLFSLPTMRVSGETRLFEDADLRARIATATDDDLDLPWRFFFTTRVSFQPPLAPSIGPVTLLPTVTREARRTFANDLEDRGFRDVNRGRTQRTRTRSGDRLRLLNYTACYGVEWNGDYDFDIEGWVGVWIRNGEFRLAGGAYPTRGFEDLLAAVGEEDATDPRRYRGTLLDFVRGVE